MAYYDNKNHIENILKADNGDKLIKRQFVVQTFGFVG